MSKNIYCIRHGVAQHNINYFKYGSKTFSDPNFVDTHLVSEGYQQAKHLHDTWTNIDSIELVIVSPLQRTLQTAVEIFKDRSIPIVALDYVREFPLGGHTCNKRSSLELLKKKYPMVEFIDFKTDNDEMWLSHREETLDELNKRIELFKSYVSLRSETNIAFVNHSSFIGQMKDKAIKYLDNGGEELKHCHPYLMKL